MPLERWNKPTDVLDAEATTPLIEGLSEKHKPTLGELNPLIYPVRLRDPQIADALCNWLADTFDNMGYRKPDHIGVSAIPTGDPFHPVDHHLIVRFGVDALTEEQIVALEKLAQETYGRYTKTRRDPGATKTLTPS